MSSNAYAGLGSIISINTGTVGSPVWTAIAELNSIALSGRQSNTSNTTTFASTSEEFLPVLPTAGVWALKGNYTSDAGRVALETAFGAKALKMFKIQLPESLTETVTGDLFSFVALIQDLNYDLQIQAAITFTASLKVSGPITITPGT
jgi:hypothetical protein